MRIQQNPLGLTPPLIFLRPVGFDPGVALALIKAAGEFSEGLVRWRLPPNGMEPDAYLAPEGALGLPALEFRNTVSETVPDESILELDEHGWYRGRPVCVVRGLAPQANPPDVQAAIEQDLAHGLRLLTTQLSRTRLLYEIGAQVWAARVASRAHSAVSGGRHPHLWLWEDSTATPLAAADTRRGRLWLLPGLEPDQLDNTQLIKTVHDPDKLCVGYEQLPLAWSMWSFSQRCSDEEFLPLLPPDVMKHPLDRRRSDVLGSKQLGRHGVAVVKMIEHGPRTAAELQEKLGLSDTTLRRVLAGLLLVRMLQIERPATPNLMGRMKAWFSGQTPMTVDQTHFGAEASLSPKDSKH